MHAGTVRNVLEHCISISHAWPVVGEFINFAWAFKRSMIMCVFETRSLERVQAELALFQRYCPQMQLLQVCLQPVLNYRSKRIAWL